MVGVLGDFQMLDPKEFHEKLLEYSETNLLLEERQAIDMIFTLLSQLFGYSIDKLSKEQQLSLVTEIVKDCKEHLVELNWMFFQVGASLRVYNQSD